ncbi:glycoside hydrolase domain-containing protein [Nocardia sp. NPDC046763]|uniref:glycoside hydrolase domain-containing protein n=1 Tax=Nocardia sp. NPDC046763 TaxID=3155256 RepID=UPI003400CAD7
MKLGLDYAGGRPAPQAIADAGYAFVVRYLCDGGPDLPGKLLTPEEACGLRAAGVSIVSNWETTAERMLDGYAAGADDARAALAQAQACGAPAGRPVYFSADFDAAPEQQPAIDDYLRGAASVLGPDCVGIYGGFWPVSRALDAGTARWGWQTDAWSGGQLDPRCAIHQRIEQATVDGVSCDVNETQVDDFGQWDHQQQEAPVTAPGIPPVPPPPPGEPLSVEYFLGFMNNVVSDGKDARQQLTGSRDLMRSADGTVDVAASFPGWPQLGGRTIVDAVAAIGAHLGLPGFADPKAGHQ